MKERFTCVICGRRKIPQVMIDDVSGPACRKHFTMEELENAEKKALEDMRESIKKELYDYPDWLKEVLATYKTMRESAPDQSVAYLTNRLGHSASSMAHTLWAPGADDGRMRSDIIEVAALCLRLLNEKWPKPGVRG